MKRYIGLLKETWWLWMLFLAFGIIGSFFDLVFLTSLPITVFSFLYFGVMRYDADGNPRQMD